MPTMKTENLEKASHEVDYLLSDLRYAHSDAVRSGNRFAEILLLNLIKDAVALDLRIKQVREAAEAEETAKK